MMTERQVGGERKAQETWEEVGKHFEALGESLGRAIEVAWQSENTQQHLDSMQEAVQMMTGKIERSISEAAESDEGKRLRREAERAAESAREAGTQTWQSVRPHVLSALTAAQAELDRMIRRLEQNGSIAEATDGQGSPPRSVGEATEPTVSDT